MKLSVRRPSATSDADFQPKVTDVAEGRHKYMICGQARDAAEGRHKYMSCKSRRPSATSEMRFETDVRCGRRPIWFESHFSLGKMWTFGHICTAWPKAYARKTCLKKCEPSATSVRGGRRPTRKNMFEIMWAFGHICPAWPKADARKSVE